MLDLNSLQIFPTQNPQQLIHLLMIFEIGQKSIIFFGPPLESKFVAKNFQNLPYLVTPQKT